MSPQAPPPPSKPLRPQAHERLFQRFLPVYSFYPALPSPALSPPFWSFILPRRHLFKLPRLGTPRGPSTGLRPVPVTILPLGAVETKFSFKTFHKKLLRQSGKMKWSPNSRHSLYLEGTLRLAEPMNDSLKTLLAPRQQTNVPSPFRFRSLLYKIVLSLTLKRTECTSPFPELGRTLP